MLQKPDPAAEMLWAMITTETTRGTAASTVEWCIDRQTAEARAAETLAEARQGEYAIQVFVMQLLRRGETNNAGLVVDVRGKVL